LLRYDPLTVQLNQDDILAGSSEGFDSKPLAITVDNVRGELRIASFQVGSHPSGNVEVARIRLASRAPEGLRFALKVEEITDLQGTSKLAETPTVKLIPVR
jgi:hypothetical protein